MPDQNPTPPIRPAHEPPDRSRRPQTVVTLDLEGVLVPEIWIAVAETTGIDALRRTTRDEPDYDVLMRYRLDLLEEHGLGLSGISDVIGGLSPLPGAADFLARLRRMTQVVILSDTFEQFAAPLMAQLDWPAIWCHRLVVDGDRISGYRPRQQDQKAHAVRALQSLEFSVMSAGDSFNDVSMLRAADRGVLFKAPANVLELHSDLEATDDYDELLAMIADFIGA